MDSSKKPVVLGQQLADAYANERERLERSPTAASPIPGTGYRLIKGEWGLLKPRRTALDEELRKLCASFSARTTEEQGRIRDAVSLEGFYTLLNYSRRAAVFALRGKDAVILEDGIAALAMIEARRTDFRDILVALALLHHSAVRIGVEPTGVFTEAAENAEPETAELIAGFLTRDGQSRNLRDAWGYVEVQTGAGIGLAQWGFGAYHPETDLPGIAMRIAAAVEKDVYIVDHIELGAHLPPVWLEERGTPGPAHLLDRSKGGAVVSARLEGKHHPDPDSQQFTLFLVELDSATTADALLRMSRVKSKQDHSMIGFAGGMVFALLVARSVMVGTEPYETDETLERLRTPLDAIIQGTRMKS